MAISRRDAKLVGPAQAARRLQISIKALRVYERHGLVKPARTARGWRRYATADLERLARVLAFKQMGFGLAQIASLLDAPPIQVAAALATQEQQLEQRRKAVDDALRALRTTRQRLGRASLRLAA